MRKNISPLDTWFKNHDPSPEELEKWSAKWRKRYAALDRKKWNPKKKNKRTV